MVQLPLDKIFTIARGNICDFSLSVRAVAPRAVSRITLACIAIYLVKLAYVPDGWPTYIFSYLPLFILWRSSLAPQNLWQVMLESSLVGTLMSWTNTQFLSPAISDYALPLHILGCLISSLPLFAAAVILWLTRSWSIFQSAPLVATLSTITEIAHARYFEVTWCCFSPALATVSTPLVQWSSQLTCFGLSFALSWIGWLWWPVFGSTGTSRWLSTAIASCAFTGLWLGGRWVESSVSVPTISFTAMIVQPHADEKLTQAPWITLDKLTVENLNSYSEPDLILWPESSLCPSWITNLGQLDECETDRADGKLMTLGQFARQMYPVYQTNCLAGLILSVPEPIAIGKVSVPAICHYNCGCLIARPTEFSYHKKQMLMPIREYVPRWIGWLPGVSRYALNLGSKITPGSEFHPLTFTDRNGGLRKIAVAICYESWFPWLPQYHCDEPLDAICHLAYDGDFKEHPEYTHRMLLAIRLRAIETRTWQLVCSHYAGTAVIDPRGRIVKQLPPGPGVLRTDRME